MKKILLITLISLVALSGFRTLSIRAEDGSDDNSIGNVGDRVKERVEAIREEYRIQQKALKQQMELRREEFKADLEAKREELKNRIENEREALKKRIENIRDSKKGEAVLRIADGLNNLNTKLLRHFTEVLEKLEKVLERVGMRVDDLSARGTDVSAVKTTMETASTTIGAARAAIEVQALKAYTVATSTESGLKQVAKEARNLLNRDLRAVYSAVKDARDAVHASAVAFGQAHGYSDDDSDDDEDLDDDNNSTSTPPVTTSTTSTTP